MYYFTAAQQTCTAKLQVFFLKIKKRLRVPRVNKTKPDDENTSNWDNFKFGVTKESNVMKELCFEFLSRILTFTLIKLNLILKKLPIEIIFTM